MIEKIKKLLGLAPVLTETGAYSPSKLGLFASNLTVPKYKAVSVQKQALGKKTVAVICTEHDELEMANGKRFLTGNHPVELFLPILHLEKAGFDIELYTPTGKAVCVEMWAMPKKDPAVTEAYQRYLPKLSTPNSLEDLESDFETHTDNVVAAYLPGGHGAVMGLPESHGLRKLLFWIKEQDKYLLTICHGPAGLLCAAPEDSQSEFIYSGYKMAVFPDLVDRVIALLGYLPGGMPWFLGKILKSLGVKMKFSLAHGLCCQDRKLISGDGPAAANKLGIKAVAALLEA